MMRIITEREVIIDAAERWRRQYPDDNFRFYDRTTAGEHWAKISALDLFNCSKAEASAAFGGFGWVENKCDECEQHKQRIIRIGEEPDYEKRWQDLCEDCVRSAIVAFDLTGGSAE